MASRKRALATLDHHVVQRVGGGAEQAAGVDQVEGDALPTHRVADDIARGPGDGRDNRAPDPGDPIEQRRLTDIRPTDEHDGGRFSRHSGSQTDLRQPLILAGKRTSGLARRPPRGRPVALDRLSLDFYDS